VVVTPPPPPPAARVEVRAPAPTVTATVVAPPPPQVHFEVAPRLVTVQPGIQVVPDYDREVFFVDGYYWIRGEGGIFYRSRDYRGGWVVAPRAVTPGVLVKVPPGHYKRWHGGGAVVAAPPPGHVVVGAPPPGHVVVEGGPPGHQGNPGKGHGRGHH
jgi:hypothetical protein